MGPIEVQRTNMISRRRFLSSAALVSAGAAVHPMFAAKTKARKIQIGHTGITWRNDQVEEAFLPIVEHMHLKDYNGKDDHLLGYWSPGARRRQCPGDPGHDGGTQDQWYGDG